MTPSKISGWPSACGLARDAQVARHRELEPAAERVAAHRRDDRARNRRDRVERFAECLGRSRAPRPGRRTREMSAPAANAFSLPATTTAFDRGVGRDCPRRVAQLPEQRDRQRVHRRVVEAQHDDAAVVPFREHEIGHGRGKLVRTARGKSTSAATGANPPASVERIDAALPGATWAHTARPRARARVPPRPAGARARGPCAPARPRSRSPSARRSRARRSARAVVVVGREDPYVGRYRDARRHADASSASTSLQPAGRARRRCPSATSSASNVVGLDPSRSATHIRNVADIGTEKSPGGTRAATSSGVDGGGEHEVPGEPDQRVGPARRRRQHLEPCRRPAGTSPRAAASSITRSGCTVRSSEQRVGRGVRIDRARRDLVDQRVERSDLDTARRARSSMRAATRPRNSLAQARPPALSRPRRSPRDAPGARGSRRTARRRPRPSSRPSARSAAPTRARPTARACPGRSLTVSAAPGAVGLVDDEDVGDLEQPGLGGLHRVAPTRVHDDDRRVGVTRDLDLDLADADRLDRRSTPCRPRRARARLAASRARARRGDRATPSNG